MRRRELITRSVFAAMLVVCLTADCVAHGQKPSSPVADQTQQAAESQPTLLVFSDFECPYSATMFRLLQRMEHGDSPKMHIVYKQSPLPIHPAARLDALAALAAGRQGHYLAMADLLYGNQTAKTENQLVSYARHIGLNETAFRRDLHSASIKAELDTDIAESQALGVTETPTFYIDGKKLVGVQSEKEFAALAANKPEPQLTEQAIDLTTGKLDPALASAIQARTTHSKGYDAAPVTIVEFTDFQCPFCRSSVEPMQKLLEARGHEVRWIVRTFPLDFHPDAQIAAEAAFAAGAQGKFWPMHDLLFANQTALTPADLHRYAGQLHLDVAKFDEAMRTHRYAGEVAADRALGDRAQVTGTPTFFVNGVTLNGVRSLPELQQVVDASLRGQPKVVAPLSGATIAESSAPAERPVYGPASGTPLVITWFTDVRGAQAARQAELVRALEERYDGRVRVLYKAFPLQAHPDSKLAAAGLMAAQKQGAFWPMYDALSSDRNAVDQAKLLSLAVQLHLNIPAFSASLDSDPSDIAADLDEATRRGVQGAPVIFLNDARVDGIQRDAFYFDIADHLLDRSAATTQASNLH